jgi:DNA-binding CsgD family transcriptional regulator
MATQHAFETIGFDATCPAPANDSSPHLGTRDDGLIFGVVFRGWARAAERRVGQPLSPRERQVIALIIDGKTRKEVAYDLDLAHSTVRVLYSRAMKKLGGRWQPRAREERTLRQ